MRHADSERPWWLWLLVQVGAALAALGVLVGALWLVYALATA